MHVGKAAWLEASACNLHTMGDRRRWGCLCFLDSALPLLLCNNSSLWATNCVLAHSFTQARYRGRVTHLASPGDAWVAINQIKKEVSLTILVSVFNPIITLNQLNTSLPDATGIEQTGR